MRHLHYAALCLLIISSSMYAEKKAIKLNNATAFNQRASSLDNAIYASPSCDSKSQSPSSAPVYYNTLPLVNTPITKAAAATSTQSSSQTDNASNNSGILLNSADRSQQTTSQQKPWVITH